jgi:hypothetical protein
MACLNCGTPLPRQFLDDIATGFCDRCREKCFENLVRLFKKNEDKDKEICLK